MQLYNQKKSKCTFWDFATSPPYSIRYGRRVVVTDKAVYRGGTPTVLQLVEHLWLIYLIGLYHLEQERGVLLY